MTVSQKTPPETRSYEPPTPVRSTWRNTVEWVMGIVGAVSLFLGLFIAFAGEGQYLGLGGDWSWRVGDITSGWMYGFLIGGAVLLLGVIGMLFQDRSR
jgi:hypothetical protein